MAQQKIFDDLMEGFGTEENAAQMQTAVDAAYQQVSAQEQEAAEILEEEMRALSEVEMRLHKANYYRTILENPLFNEYSEAATQVEEEVRAFVMERLQILMGLRPDDARPQAIELPFSDAQVMALARWADKLLGNSNVLNGDMVAAKKAPVPAAPPRLQPVQLQPMAQPQLAPRRGRGRPPGTGKHQKAAAAAQEPRKQLQRPSAPPPQQQAPAPGTNPDIITEGGKQFIQMPGRDLKTGEEKLVNVDVTPTVKPKGAQPAPFPAANVALMVEMQRADEIQQKLSGFLNKAMGAMKI